MNVSTLFGAYHNETDKENDDTCFKVLETDLLIVLGVFVVLQLFLFSTSLFLALKERKTDKKNPTKTFSKFFVFIVASTLVLSMTQVIIFLIARVFGHNLIFGLHVFFDLFLFGLFSINTAVCQLLVALLAIHRVLTYFHRNLFKCCEWIPEKLIVIILYLLVSFEIYLVASGQVTFIVNKSDIMEKVFPFEVHFLLITFPVLITTVPYTTMLLTMGTSSRLVTRLQFRSERFVANLIKISFFSKLLSLISLQLGHWIVQRTDMVSLVIVLDAKMFPLLVQLAFILSNRTFGKSLIDWIKRKWVNRVGIGITV